MPESLSLSDGEDNIRWTTAAAMGPFAKPRPQGSFRSDELRHPPTHPPSNRPPRSPLPIAHCPLPIHPATQVACRPHPVAIAMGPPKYPPQGNHPLHIHPARPLYRFAATALGASMWFFVR